MRVVARLVVIALGAAALVTLAGASGGCGDVSEKAPPQWERVTSAQVSGDQPIKLSLGDHRLGDRVRLAWVLSGPENPPVTLTLRAINIEDGGSSGYAMTPESEGHAIDRQDDQAMLFALTPGEYRIFFSQRFPPARGPGYDIKLTLYTMQTTP